MGKTGLNHWIGKLAWMRSSHEITIQYRYPHICDWTDWTAIGIFQTKEAALECLAIEMDQELIEVEFGIFEPKTLPHFFHVRQFRLKGEIDWKVGLDEILT